MIFNYNYALIQKINELENGLLCAIKIINFTTIAIIQKDKRECDKLLAILAEKLQQELQFETFRYNHDTFFVLSKNVKLTHEMHEKITNIGTEIFSVFFMISIGYTEFQSEQPNDVINKALAALDIATQNNKSKVSYDKCVNEVYKLFEVSEKSTIFHNAIKKNNLKLFFQPIVDIENQNFLFHEALLRINDQNTIYDFITASEKTGLINLVDTYVIKSGIEMIQNIPDLKLSINFSVVNINDESWVNEIFSILSDVPLVTKRLIIEITENSVFNKYDKIFDFIFKFKSIGCKIAIDDFGESFYLPFLKLEKLPIDFIKLDGEFARGALNDENVKLFIDTMIKIANNSGIKIIAEFVENNDTFELFKGMGIKYMQGNFFHKASPEIVEAFN
jgi:EAL domain-containing protein (putative c-di-GMP-specific phosphodiesterase class I)/GGDEF domain-containing protein